LVLVGDVRDTLTGSLYAREVLRETGSAPPPLDLGREARLQELAVMAAAERWVRAAHDVSQGGLAMTLVEMLLATPVAGALGTEVDLAALEAPADVALFGESPAILFEVTPSRAAALFQAARERHLTAWPVGTVATHGELRVLLPDGARLGWTREMLSEAVAAPLARLWNEDLA
jgi:phosphoribosylformylglycinamidine synthase